ncbi:MAG: hypothetical protein DBX93_02280 [Oscillospiraceae bacterium]|nr:MAG: hypothetical protein DBX93_02280 [Oscillospiraceae bacterium]
MRKLVLADIRPHVRYSKPLLLPEDFSTTAVHAYDARLIYFFSGSAKVKLDDRSYNASRGSLFLWQSATCYSIVNCDAAETKMMAINFDYVGTGTSVTTPALPTVSDRLYRRENAIESIYFEDVPQLNMPVHLDGMQTLERIFQPMSDEYNYPRPFDKLMLSSLMQQAIFTVARKLTLGSGEKPSGLVERVTEYIRENFAGDLSNEAIGRHFNYHPNYINRVMQKHIGQSLHQYVLSCRVSRALEMLQTTNLSVTEVSERVGFSSIKHFSQTFKSIYGYSPIHFRD